MDAVTRGHWQNVLSSDREVQGAAYSYLLKATSAPVDWAYEVWDDLSARCATRRAAPDR